MLCEEPGPLSSDRHFVTQHGIGLLVTDFDPLRIQQNWKAGVCHRMDIPVHEVDAHNVVPCWLASPKWSTQLTH